MLEKLHLFVLFTTDFLTSRLSLHLVIGKRKGRNRLASLERIDLSVSPRLSNATSVCTNYTPCILPHFFVTSFRFKYQFHDCGESEIATPLGAEVSNGAKTTNHIFSATSHS